LLVVTKQEYEKGRDTNFRLRRGPKSVEKNDPETTREIKFKYMFSQDYNPVFVTGAHGGVTPRGDIVVNFFMERQPLPNYVTNQIAEDGKIGKELNRHPEDNKRTILRFVEVGIVLDIKGAKSIAEFLQKHITSYEQHFTLEHEEVTED